jgi:iduronate 2-sulfatase
LVEQPNRKWKEAAISYWPVGRDNPAKLVMGVAVKTDRYRYTEWIKVSTGEVVARDLFDHQLDPAENHGIAEKPENKKVIDELSLLLDKGKGWRKISSAIK